MNATAQHKRGPLHLECTTINAHVIDAAGRYIVSMPIGHGYWHQPHSVWEQSQDAAYARLFVAAPELLAAAQSLINGLDTGLVRFDTDADETLENTMINLRIAVAKATAPKA